MVLHEVQQEYPGIVGKFSLFQPESEPHYLAEKRCCTLIQSFREAGLDMDWIALDSRVYSRKNFTKHLLFTGTSALDPVGAVLGVKVLLAD